jgi:DNA-binding NarL/FixJ family response regulator
VRIAVVEDHQLICDVICKICIESGHEVVCRATNGSDAIRQISDQSPDLIVLDLMLPDIDGFEVASRARCSNRPALILAISSRCDPFTVYKVQKVRFHGFIDKGFSTISDIMSAINALNAGKTWFAASFRRVQDELRADPVGFYRILSERQLEVLAMVGDGCGIREMGHRLDIKPASCEKFRYRIRKRLDLKSNQALVHYARSFGFSSFIEKTGLVSLRETFWRNRS